MAEVKPELEGVSEDEVERREDITYLKGSDTPYSGKVYALHPNGQKLSEVNYKDGKMDGLQLSWHENGQKAVEGNFKDGKLDGPSVMWHKNGQKKGEANFKDGILISEKFWNSKGEPVDSREEAEAE